MNSSFPFPKLFLALLLVAFGYALPAQSSKNVTLKSILNYADPGRYNLAGVWSYAAGGKEYALVGVYDGLSIVDVTDPSTPTELFHLTHTPSVTSLWHEIKTWSHYAYVTNEQGDGLRIVDLQDLPDSVQFKDVVLDSMFTSHTLTIDEKGYLYLNGGPGARQGMGIFDLNPDPWNPVQVGSWHDRYIHDQYVRNDTAYVGEILDGMMEIIDLSDRSNPTVIGSKSYINSFTHNTWLNDAGTVCFTTDELEEAYIYAWDVTDPTDITLLDGIRASSGGGMGIPHNVQVLNDYLVTSYYRDGLHVVDAARPHNLVEVAYYDPYPAGVGFEGFWGVDPFLPSGLVLGSDMYQGLYVFEVDYKRGCYLEGIVTDSVTGLPINGVTVTFSGGAEKTNGDGFYATGVADSGSYSVTFTSFGYVTKTVDFTLDNGVVTLGDVALAPSGRKDVTIRVVDAASGNPIPGAKVRLHEPIYGLDFDYVTNAAGEAIDPSMVKSSYQLFVGHWGHFNRLIPLTVNDTTGLVTVALQRGYADNFSLDLGWTPLAFAQGEWEYGEPVGTYNGPSIIVNPETDVNSDFGDRCYVTGNGGGSIDTDDVDGGESILESPEMDLSGMGKPVLKFFRYFYNGGGGGASLDDTLRIEITNGTDTRVLKRIVGFTHDFWKRDTFDLKSILPPGFLSAPVKLRVVCGDYGADHTVEGGLDDFSLIDQAPVGMADAIPHQAARLAVYPNPTGAHATVRCELPGAPQMGELTFQLHDLSGRLLDERTFSVQQTMEWELPMPYAAGVYFASVRMEGQLLKAVKVIR